MQKKFHYVLNKHIQPGLMPLVERGYVPDTVLRWGMRRMLESTIKKCALDGNCETQQKALNDFIENLKTREIAEQTAAANKQHYEVPSELYKVMLGPWLKYSSGYWPTENTTLEESEEAMLDLVCERAELGLLPPGAKVLDLGCGWGSCALYIASKYPHLKIFAVSNSSSQKEFIEKTAEERGLTNLQEVRTCDVNVLSYAKDSFDRIVSNEMFEHMKNYKKLLNNISLWLKPRGKLFVHIFTHREFTYHFENGWMAETFFTGGTMPGKDLLGRFNDDMTVENQWSVNGKHYSRTLEAWLKKLDVNAKKLRPMFTSVYGKGNENKWVFNWRLFNMACSELFRYNDGNEWFVSHYRFVNNRGGDAKSKGEKVAKN